MADTATRRAVLGSGVAAVAGSLAGCALNNPEVPGGHLFVENVRPADYRVHLTVREGRDREGDAVVDAWYRIPAEHALQFEEVIAPETAYTITVHRPTVDREDVVTVTVPVCDGDGARDVSVRVRPDAMGVIPWGCDEEYTELELTYVDPGEYEVDPPRTTATTPTDA